MYRFGNEVHDHPITQTALKKSRFFLSAVFVLAGFSIPIYNF